MSKYNRGKARRYRVWRRNVGDGGVLTKEGRNPNDQLQPKRRAAKKAA